MDRLKLKIDLKIGLYSIEYLCGLCSRCGQETRVIPRILQMKMHWSKSEKENVRLTEAGISKEVSLRSEKSVEEDIFQHWDRSE